MLPETNCTQNKPGASWSEMSLLTVGEEASEDVTAVTELLWLCVCVVGGWSGVSGL